MHNIRAHGRDIALGPLAFLGAQAEMLGYAAATVGAGGAAVFLLERGPAVSGRWDGRIWFFSRR